MKLRILWVLLTVFLVSVLTNCGFKGPLYLPKKQQASAAKKASSGVSSSPLKESNVAESAMPMVESRILNQESNIIK